MTHWSEKYISQKYDRDMNNCGDIFIKVQRDIFNKKVDEINAIAKSNKANSEKLDLIKSMFVNKVEQPQDGDGALINLNGRTTHIGVVCIINKGIWILHGMSSKKGIVLTPVNRLRLLNCEISGYYRLND